MHHISMLFQGSSAVLLSVAAFAGSLVLITQRLRLTFDRLRLPLSIDERLLTRGYRSRDGGGFFRDLKELFSLSDDDITAVSGYLRGIPEEVILKIYSIPVKIYPENDVHAGLLAPEQKFSVAEEDGCVGPFALEAVFAVPEEPFLFPLERNKVAAFGRQRVILAKVVGGDGIIVFVPKHNMN